MTNLLIQVKDAKLKWTNALPTHVSMARTAPTLLTVTLVPACRDITALTARPMWMIAVHNHVKMGEPALIRLTVMSVHVLQDSLVGTWVVLCWCTVFCTAKFPWFLYCNFAVDNHMKMGEPEFIGLTIMSVCVLQGSLVGTWEVLFRYRSLHSQNSLVMVPYTMFYACST